MTVPTATTGRLSARQERLWFLSQLRPDSPFGTIVRAVRLRGSLDPDRLDRALRTVLERHPVLRTAFPGVVGRADPTVAETPRTSLVVLPATGADLPSRLAAEARHVFDIASPPLLRATLLRLADDDHVLCLAAHQLVLDARSLDLLIALLGEQSGDEPAEFGAFAESLLRRLESGELDAGLAYWRDRLAGAPAALELPTDLVRPAMAGFSAAVSDVDLPVAVAGLADARTALPAAFLAVLARYSGREDVLVDWDAPTSSAVLGPVGNTLVVRTAHPAGQTFTGLMSAVTAEVTAARRHGEIPFEHLVDRLTPARDLSRNPIVQVRVAVRPAPSLPTLPGVTTEPIDVAPAATQYDLELVLTEQAGGGWTARLVHATDLFAAPTVERLAAAYAGLLEAVAENPGAVLSSVELLMGPDRVRLAGWNATGAPTTGRPVHQLVEARAAEAPDHPALEYDGRAHTYRELDERANQVAHWLAGRGVTPGDVVGVRLPRGPRLITTFLGVLKAGAAYLPLDPGDPPERVRFVTADAGATLVITDGEPLDDELNRQPAHNPGVPVHPEDAAYVIYTSGSTGRPKGVSTPHRGFANLVEWHVRRHAVTPHDRCGQLSRTVFDASVWETGPALAAGATLVVAPPDIAANADAVLEWVRDRRLTIAFLPIQITERLFRRPDAADLSLRVLLTGSDRLMQYPPAGIGFEVVNHYGPTETSVIAAAGTVPAAYSARPPSIGSPIANTQVHVLDLLMHRVPVGAPGELYVGGAAVGRGYLSRPALTAERFVPDPYSGRPGARLYRTGDLARWLPDGTLEFLGRSDNQVKIRGYRIECGEIEACLLTHPAVAEAAVVAREDVPGEKRLVGYLVTTDDTELGPSELRPYLAHRLPDYMIPAAWVTLAEFPKNTSGKVDRNALPAPAPTRPDLDGPYVAPRTDLEKRLAHIFAEVLGLETVGVYDNFFELGGHSLLATKIVGSLIDDLGIDDIDLRVVFELPTVAELATALANRSERDEQ